MKAWTLYWFWRNPVPPLGKDYECDIAWNAWQARAALASRERPQTPTTAPMTDLTVPKDSGESKKSQQNSGPEVGASPAAVPSTTEEQTT